MHNLLAYFQCRYLWVGAGTNVIHVQDLRPVDQYPENNGDQFLYELVYGKMLPYDPVQQVEKIGGEHNRHRHLYQDLYPECLIKKHHDLDYLQMDLPLQRETKV